MRCALWSEDSPDNLARGVLRPDERWELKLSLGEDFCEPFCEASLREEIWDLGDEICDFGDVGEDLWDFGEDFADASDFCDLEDLTEDLLAGR